ncbi:unnamed protein product [Phytophthora fragariaefolia]|uniref:Unnamed protein product n=1 Tax=Phytophthora fragariaefolia TaxID=1490495 RepID=A0A9W6YCP2_9STRA|nr:unnamed protein product [Phytophthora fragariaefolia]
MYQINVGTVDVEQRQTEHSPELSALNFKEMPFQASRACTRRLLAAPQSTALLFVLSLVVASSLHVASAHTALRETNNNDDAYTRRLSGGGGDKNSTIPFNSWSNAIDTLQYVLAFVVVLVAAHPLGLFFPKLFNLPLITGYLVIGIIAGPFVANLLTEGLVNMLSSYVSALALSFISFQAGQEIYLPELRPQLKAIMILLGALYVTAMIILTAAILLAEGAFFYDDLGFYCQLGIALMFGSISVLGSPATVMAIKIELNSVGPFTSLMLGATMTAEFVVLISFSISRIVCSIYCAKLDVSMLNLVYTMSIVGANVLVGVILAGVTILIFKIPGGDPHHGEHSHGEANSPYYDQKTGEKVSTTNPDMTPHPHNGADECTVDELQHEPSGMLSPKAALSLKGFIWLSMGYVFYISTTLVAEATAAAYGLSWEIKFEPLLVLMIASCIAGHHVAIRHDMHVILDTVAPYMFLPFFVMTGAALKLDQVVAAIPLMSLYVVLRYIAIFIACYFGGRFLLKLTPRQYNNLWLTMTPQAGVALGLANEVKAMSDEPWAAEFAATIVAAVVVNQIVGPVLCAMGLSRAGETLQDRMAAADAPKEDMDSVNKSIYGGRFSNIHGGGVSSISQFEVSRRMSSPAVTLGNGDPRSLLPFYKVQNAVVIGDDEIAFEIALELSLYGAQVNVPLLDEERTSKWKKMNETILSRTAKGDLISYKNTLKDRNNAQAMSSADVLIFTGDANRTRENVHLLKSLLGASHPRMIAFVPDCKFSKEMKAQGVLVIQPSIAMANIATRMALLDQKLAEALSNEISTTSDFSTASYFLRGDGGDLSDMRLEGRRLALGRNVVNHHSVDYDRLAEALVTENLPMPPPPSRVAMFGTSSAAGFDPFQRERAGSEFFVMHDEEEGDEIVMDAQYGPLMPKDSLSIRNAPLRAPRSSVLLPLLLAVASISAVSADATQREDNSVFNHDDTTRRLSGATGDEDKTVPFNSWNNTIDTLRYGLAFVIVLVAAHPLGLFFPKFFKLPLITGYLVIGIITGPFVANLLTEGLVNMLSSYVSALALSFISFQAGQEIYLPELRPQLKAIMILLGTLYMTAMVILTSVHLLVESAFFYDELALSCQLGIALMFGSISVLGSPATVMAIKIELNSVGPFTSLMLGATMTAEFVVLVSFSISRIVCSIYCAELNVSMSNLMFTLGIVMSNVLLGVILAGCTFLVFMIPGGEPHHEGHAENGEDHELNNSTYYNQKTDSKPSTIDSDSHPHPHNGYNDDIELGNTRGESSPILTPHVTLCLKGFIWLTMGYMFYISTSTVAKATAAAFGLSWEIKFEPLLVLMIASCIAGHHSSIRHDMHVILDTAAPYFFLPFFVMTGAALKLDQVVAAIPLMTVYVLLRYVAIFLACYFGGRFLLKLSPRQYNNLWLTMTPQAGVALGLANEVKAMSDEEWAAEFAATIVAAVVVNQIVGPVLCAMGLSRAGETLQDRGVVDNEENPEQTPKVMEQKHDNNNEIEKFRRTRPSLRISQASRLTIHNTPDQHALFTKVQNAVVIGDDEIAFEIALELSLYGAQVNVSLLDEERTSKWKKMNETILSQRALTEIVVGCFAPSHDRVRAGLQIQQGDEGAGCAGNSAIYRHGKHCYAHGVAGPEVGGGFVERDQYDK